MNTKKNEISISRLDDSETEHQFQDNPSLRYCAQFEIWWKDSDFVPNLVDGLGWEKRMHNSYRLNAQAGVVQSGCA